MERDVLEDKEEILLGREESEERFWVVWRVQVERFFYGS